MKRSKVLVAERAALEYKAGKITLTEAAHRAEMTIWEMQNYLVGKGFHSRYSVEDLQKELRELEIVRPK